MKVDVIIGISSYNRYEMVNELVNSLKQQDTIYNYKIVIMNDNSVDDRYELLNRPNDDIILISNDENYGKKKYWLTIDKLFKYLKNTNFDYFIQLDDDFKICNNFIDIAIDTFTNCHNENLKVCAMSLHLNKPEDLFDNRWCLGNSWIDGGTIYTEKILDKLKYTINEVPSTRWNNNPNLSSGVWHQISQRISNLGYIIVKPSHSFVNNIDNGNSNMNKNQRITHPIFSYNFIGNQENPNIKISPIVIPKS